MMHKSMVLVLALLLVASSTLATPIAQRITGTLLTLPTLDTYNDTIKYDNNTIYWWYGGLTSFRLATRFTPLANFKLQQFQMALNGVSAVPITLNVKADSAGLPGGAPIWTGSMVYNTSNTWRSVYIDTTGLPQLTFSAGTDFWLEIISNGPPFEIYDNAPVQPPRSKTYYAPFGGWVDSPGDNFIRAAGEYTNQVVDVGIDSIYHGQNFFLPNPGTLLVGARVKNYGAAAQTFQVACSLFTEQAGPTYPFFQALPPQTITVGPGLTFNVSFTPPVNIATNNRYRIRARTMLVDSNPDNNARDTETQIYTLPSELRYDDDYYSSAAYSSVAGDGWAMKFNPNQTSPYNITQIKVMTEFATGDSVSKVQVVDDNGAGGTPNTVLWETTQLMTTGWNIFNVNLTNQTGAFYVVYIFQYGALSSSLRMDNYPGSGMAWAKNTGVWAPIPAADDWMMRATIATGGGGPTLDIVLAPVGPPPIIPSTGGAFNFNATISNLSTSSQTFDAWIMLQLPNLSWYGPVLGPVNLTLAGSATITRLRTQNIPGNAPTGMYTYRGYLGTYATGVKVDSSSFTFTKSPPPPDGGAWVGNWENAGESFTTVTPSDQLPGAYRLGEAYPNPFNPETSIEFALPQAGTVNLSVFSVTGSLVKSLVNGWQEAGNHRVSFDASGLPSGIYLYKLTSGDFSAVNKMVLMK